MKMRKFCRICNLVELDLDDNTNLEMRDIFSTADEISLATLMQELTDIQVSF